MRFHPEELQLARAYTAADTFEALTREQTKLVMERGRALYHWFKQHPGIHFLINLTVLLALFTLDYLILMRLPALLFTPEKASPWHTAGAALLTGGLHSWVLYSITVMSMHEGAAHGIIFPHDDPVSRLLSRIAANLCRLAASEPRYYAEHHMSHHAKFGTPEDGEFLNYVRPRRYWLTLLPYASSLNYSDFIAHRPMGYSRSRLVSALAAVTYHVAFGYFMAQSFGLTFTLISLVLFVPHVGFYLDRLRQFSEHNLMPLDNKDGSRSFGLGFWGMLIGGGPWGSPCHWEHHLVASLPWYGQLVLHRYLVKILTPRQREQYLLRPVIGYPQLLWRLWREPARFERKVLQSSPAARSSAAS